MAEPESTQPVSRKKPSRLFKWRQCPVPTWRGWLLLVLGMALLVLVFMASAYPFLAKTSPIKYGALVVEGWAADDTLKSVLTEYRKGGYEHIYVVGGPIDRGFSLSAYGSFAEIGRAVLLKEGAAPDKVTPVPAPFVPQDRTYTAFLSLEKYFQTNGYPKAIHLMSEGAHARRSALMLETVMGDRCVLGVTSVPPSHFDARRWWKTSAGFKHVLNEGLSYLYARVFFRPE